MSFNRGSNWTWSGRDRGSNRGGYGRGGGIGGRGNWRGGRRGFRGAQPPHGSFGGFRGGNQQNFGNRGANQQWNNRPKREMPGKRLSEDEIGVTEYVNDHEGFLGIIKSRYSDFQVSEINEKGEVAKLTSLAAPPAPTDEAVVEDEDLLLSKYNLEILPMDTWDKINKLAVCKDADVERVEVDVTGMSKEQRTKIHDAVKKAFGDSIVGSTVSEADKKFVRFDKFRKGVRIDNRVKWMWPGEYTYFVLHKENCDTMDAAVRLAERLRLNIKPSMLGYAGTKDRRAKTSQWFSLRKVDPRKVATACRDLRDVRVGNFSFDDKNLRLGMLQGNKFRIALRNVKAADEAVEAACRLLTERGFINYYGLQRFGSRADTPTYNIGVKLLQGNFKEAIAGILEEREGPIQHALRLYKEGGAEAALRVWPRHAPNTSIEVRVLKALAKKPNDLLGALNKLARNTRLLYLHSYQSLVWNRAVSERVRRAGLAPAAGDLVPLSRVDLEEEIDERESDSEEGAETDSETQDGSEKTEQDAGDNPELPTGPELSKATLETSIKAEKEKVPVKVLTQSDVDSGKYTVFDVVLPLPGSSVEYPPNMKEYYEELLAKDGLTLEMKHKLKSYSMSGAYRHMVVRPLDVSWRCVRYSDPFCDLILSDWDELEGRQLTGIEEEGLYKALLLTMTLPASCYATMALRELLKVDTSCDNQALQNNYHKKKAAVKTESKDTKEEKEVETAKEESDDQTLNGKKCEMEVESEDKVGEKRKVDSQSEEVNVKKLKTEVDEQ